MGVTQSTGHAAKSENEFLDEKLPDLPESVVTLLSTWPCQGLRPGLARASGLVLAQEQVRDRTQYLGNWTFWFFFLIIEVT